MVTLAEVQALEAEELRIRDLQLEANAEANQLVNMRNANQLSVASLQSMSNVDKLNRLNNERTVIANKVNQARSEYAAQVHLEESRIVETEKRAPVTENTEQPVQNSNLGVLATIAAIGGAILLSR